jgi:hypothetical protein
VSEPKIVEGKHEGAFQTQIVSEEWDHFGQGVFDVRVHEHGISLRPYGEKEWKDFTFSDLMTIDLIGLISDFDYCLERYTADQTDKVHLLEEKLQKLKAATLGEIRARQSRKKFSVEAKPPESAA